MPQPDEYVFARDYLHSNRVNLHHYIWIETFGYHLHPGIPREGSHLRIADVGTGTAVWLSGVSRQMATTTQLDGYDVSLDCTPPAKWMPQNVSLHEWNVFDDIPEHLVGTYDILHVRHLVFVLNQYQIAPMLEKFLKLLKPGGYIQWGEMDLTSFRVETVDPAVDTEPLIKLIQLSQNSEQKLDPRWVPTLSQVFADSNLEAIVTDKREMLPDVCFRMHECGLMTPELTARKSQDTAWVEAVRAVMPEVQRVTSQGAMWAFTSYTVIGRKPVEALKG